MPTERLRPARPKAALAPLLLLCVACAAAPVRAGHARPGVTGDTRDSAWFSAARDDGPRGPGGGGVAPAEPGPGVGDGHEDEALELEAELELTAARLHDVSLDTDGGDDVLVREAELVAAAAYRPGPGFEAFGELALIAEREDFGGATRPGSGSRGPCPHAAR